MSRSLLAAGLLVVAACGGDSGGGTAGPAATVGASGTVLDPTTGLLTLRVRPGDAQVFVDGAYVGTAGDFAQGRRKYLGS